MVTPIIHSNSGICKILENGDQFDSTVTKKKYQINFPFDCDRLLRSLFINMESVS